MPVKPGDLHEIILPVSSQWYAGAANSIARYLKLFHLDQGK